MITNKNKKTILLIFSILFIIILIVVIKTLYNKNIESFSNSIKYKLGKVLETGERSIIYEVNVKQNNKKIDYIYKKILVVEQTSIDEQVKINNNFKYSPEIIDYGKDYYIIEKYDLTLEKLFITNQFDSKKLKNLVKVLREYNKYRYNIDDLHLDNIVWSNKKKKFGIIDWDLVESKDKRVDNNLKDLDFIEQFISKRCKTIEPRMKKKYIIMFKQIYNNQYDEKELLNTFKNIENQNEKIKKQNNIIN